MASKESLSSTLAVFGVSDEQTSLIHSHLQLVESEALTYDGGLEEAYGWLNQQTKQVFPADDARSIINLVRRNTPVNTPLTKEQGFDSCQSRRALAKIVGEGITIGGFLREYKLMGLPITLTKAQNFIGSRLDISPSEISIFENFIEQGCADQDFLFPGVTSADPVKDLEAMAIQTLSGQPPVSVRSITGLGGLRFDNEDNAVVDMLSFFEQKLTKDRRFYPGAAVFHALVHNPPDSIPLFLKMKTSHPHIYRHLIQLSTDLKSLTKSHVPDVATMCCAAIPTWNQVKTALLESTDTKLELSASFHSPAYDISFLEELISDLHYQRPISPDTVVRQINMLRAQTDNLFSFNNPLHLPFTQDRSNLSHQLMGQITNHRGDSCIRFGIGYHNRSIEIREYTHGPSRSFQQPTGKLAYEVRFFENNHLFQGGYQSWYITPKTDIWQAIQRDGFIKASLHLLQTL